MTAEFEPGAAVYDRPRRPVVYEPKPACPCGDDHETAPRAQNCPDRDEEMP